VQREDAERHRRLRRGRPVESVRAALAVKGVHVQAERSGVAWGRTDAYRVKALAKPLPEGAGPPVIRMPGVKVLLE
jgi:hypothetical protein